MSVGRCGTAINLRFVLERGRDRAESMRSKHRGGGDEIVAIRRRYSMIGFFYPLSATLSIISVEVLGNGRKRAFGKRGGIPRESVAPSHRLRSRGRINELALLFN